VRPVHEGRGTRVRSRPLRAPRHPAPGARPGSPAPERARAWYASADGKSVRSWPFQANSNRRCDTLYATTSMTRLAIMGDARSVAQLSARLRAAYMG